MTEFEQNNKKTAKSAKNIHENPKETLEIFKILFLFLRPLEERLEKLKENWQILIMTVKLAILIIFGGVWTKRKKTKVQYMVDNRTCFFG